MKNCNLGINFGFENEKFFVEYNSCSRKVDNLKIEFDRRARELYSYNKKLMLGISSGLDSQAVMHSFCTQGLDIQYAFLHLPGFNDFEFENLKILINKYSIDPIIIDMDPISLENDLMEEYRETGIPPNHIMHSRFLKKLPNDYDFIQGIHGPDITVVKNKWYVLETANSLEITRLRAFLQVEREGKIIGWERTPEIMSSLLTDEVIASFMHSSKYILSNGLVYNNGKEIPLIDHWDLYIKPFIYGKYWKNELEYFSKYQGVEKVEWLINRKWHDYKKNLVLVPYQQLIDHFNSNSLHPLKMYENYS
jgi:hypothetical protein